MLKFLSLEKEGFGMDISDLSLKLVALKKRRRGFEVCSFNQVEIKAGVIEKGVIQNESAFVEAIKEAYKSVKGKKLATKYVVASLPEEKSFLQIIQMPSMDENELATAVVFEAENYIPLPVSEVYLDYSIIRASKDHLDVLIVAMPKKIVNSYFSCLKKAGLTPLVLEIESEAIARALVNKSDALVVLVDFGKTSTVFVVYAGGSIQFTCSIPVSSDQLTLAISKTLGITMEKAEKLKQKYDPAHKKDENTAPIAKAMAPVLENMALQIKKYIDYYQEHAYHQHSPAHQTLQSVLLCGGGANLKGLPEFLSQNLKIPVALGDISAYVTSKKDVEQINQHLTTALGLALRGTET